MNAKHTSMLVAALALSFSAAVPPLAAGELPAAMREKIDAEVANVLAKTGAPSASIAVVRDGELAYRNAYGLAALTPKRAATPAMRYSIGSISKQFTAAAILLLAEEGKISLDDKLVRWFPELTGADRVTVRQMLSMTSGYQDFWPEDYVMPMMLQPVTPDAILARWGRMPLDFEPGTKWQYSNTNYVIAGMIVEKVAGEPLLGFLRRRVFTPLHMASVVNTDEAPLGADEPQRYLRYALGPARPAPKEGPGWMFAAGELAMTASDLAAWDISMIDGSILAPASTREMETEQRLASGVGSGYGLGVSVSVKNGRRLIAHGGEVSGFTARNEIYPDDRAAIVVQVNMDATGASTQIAAKIADTLFASTDEAAAAALGQARAIFAGLQKGTLDRTLLTANANAYFTEQALADCAASLGPLGAPTKFEQVRQGLRGGMVSRRFRVVCGDHTLGITTYTMPGGLLEQFIVASGE